MLSLKQSDKLSPVRSSSDPWMLDPKDYPWIQVTQMSEAPKVHMFLSPKFIIQSFLSYVLQPTTYSYYLLP